MNKYSPNLFIHKHSLASFNQAADTAERHGDANDKSAIQFQLLHYIAPCAFPHVKGCVTISTFTTTGLILKQATKLSQFKV